MGASSCIFEEKTSDGIVVTVDCISWTIIKSGKHQRLPTIVVATGPTELDELIAILQRAREAMGSR